MRWMHVRGIFIRNPEMPVDTTWRHQTAKTYQGSNSWIILSKRMTANNRELNPASHASESTKNAIKLFHPPRFDSAERISPLDTLASAILTTYHFGTVSTCQNSWRVLLFCQYDLMGIGISTFPAITMPQVTKLCSYRLLRSPRREMQKMSYLVRTRCYLVGTR